MPTPAPCPTTGELFRAFCSAGARGFGGMLPWARRMLVEERRWLTPEEFTEAFAVCPFLPGPNVVNLTAAIGDRFRGWRGALAALAGLFAFPLLIVTTLGALYTRFGALPGVGGVLRGMGAVAAGLVLATGLKMAAPLARAPRPVVFLVAAFVAVGLLRWPLVPVLLVLAPLSVLTAWGRGV